MKKYLTLLLLLAIALLLQGCKDKYCPCYPTDNTQFLPTDYIGQTLRYLVDGDTAVLTVQPPVLSEKYPYPEIADIVDKCNASAQVTLTSSDDLYILYCTRILSMLDYQGDIDRWFMNVHTLQKGVAYQFNSMDKYTTKGHCYEILSGWTSPTGESYGNVCFMTDQSQKDSAYFSLSLGLLYLKTTETRWTLLP